MPQKISTNMLLFFYFPETMSTSVRESPSKDLKLSTKKEYNVYKSLNKLGFHVSKHLAITLQGKLLLCKNQKEKKIVVKVTSQKLHKNGITFVGNQNKMVKIDENIVKEVAIMRHLQTKKPPKGIRN